MERKLLDIGFRLVEDVARRKKHAGDRIMQHNDTGLVLTLDHKSTRGYKEITLKREQFDKLRKEARDRTVPAITFSFRSCHRVYIAFDIDDLEGVMY